MFSGAASAIKNRLRLNHGGSNSTATAESANRLTSSKSTPDLSLKSGYKDPVSTSLQIRKIGDGFDDDDDDNLGQMKSSNPMTRSFDFREDPSFWEDHNVQVIIRVRPLNSSELSVQGQSRCVRQDCSQSITWTGNPESRFTFDHVADEHVSQEMLFKVAGVPMVENTVGGYNSCMFAYGQTGSGKTHTMLGDIEEGTRRHSVNCGMTPRVFEYMFSRIQKEKEVRREEKIRFTCRCSFLEIYNEHILDLLDPSATNLQIREDTKKGVYVENLTEIEVTSARDVIQQLVQGAANRKVASTNMNRASSRSHSVFTCVVESKWESQGVTHHRFSRLNLVDLAGSERQKSSGAEGERLKEATNINKSLSTLGLVIMNLVNMSNGKSLHIPYRDSKLTFLLQESLGGNAKTIIIANISPSICSSLETLSTLKFAQRAKFIKNNAIVNEDASGDVLAMRAQIQNLKKEVSHLRSLVNGGADNHEEDDSCLASAPGTPGPFKWDGLNELSTPLTKPHKKTSKNEYEIALVGAFRREKDKDITIQSLTAENQAALQLAKQREDEIQGLKMRLRFREAAVKRLEAVASGKIPAETHLIKERDEHLKEIDVLRTEVASNPEVTRFAMENLRVKEEIRRLKSFYEEGERERMMEQITMLQNKLLEALDWKLMNEANLSTVQKERFKPGADLQDDGFLLSSGQESVSPWRTAVNEENEFLRMQAIHNQSELDALHKRLDFCVHEKERLESHVKDLEAELDAERASRSQKEQPELSVVPNNLMPSSAVCDQVELKTLVDAIATASEREAEAHELTMSLSKENDQLKMKLKVLLDDNNKLIELYERSVSENQTSNGSQNCLENVGDLTSFAAHQKELDVTAEADNLKQQLVEMHEENDRLMSLYEKAAQKELDVTAEAGNLKQQLVEMHEENDRLLALYEKAAQKEIDVTEEAGKVKQQLMEMHEENDRLMALYEKPAQMEVDVTAEAGNLKQQLLELHEENDKLMGLYEKAMQERDELKWMLVSAEQKYMDIKAESNCPEKFVENGGQGQEFNFTEARSSKVDIISENEAKSTNLVEVTVLEDRNLIRRKLVEAQEKLSNSAMSLNVFSSLEKAIQEVDELSQEIEKLNNRIHVKQESFESSKHLSLVLQERRVVLDKKLIALKYTITNFVSSVGYFGNREAQARVRYSSTLASINRKKEELARLEICKGEIVECQSMIKQSDGELINNLAAMKAKLEEENRRLEKDRVLVAIDNVEQTDAQALQTNWQLTGKATDLLKSEEEIPKLQSQIKKAEEKHAVMKKDAKELDRKAAKVENEIKTIQEGIQDSLLSVEELSNKLQIINQEKEAVLAMQKEGREKFENMIHEYYECVFEAEMREKETKILSEDVEMELSKLKDLQDSMVAAVGRKAELMEEITCQSCFLSDKIEEDLYCVNRSIMEVNSMLGDFDSNDS